MQLPGLVPVCWRVRYYGQTIQIWSALFMAAALAAVLVMIVGFAHSYVLRRMGEKPEGVAA